MTFEPRRKNTLFIAPNVIYGVAPPPVWNRISEATANTFFCGGKSFISQICLFSQPLQAAYQHLSSSERKKNKKRLSVTAADSRLGVYGQLNLHFFFFFLFFFLKKILLSRMRIYRLTGDSQLHPSELLDAVRLHPDDVQQLRGQGSRGPFLYKTHPRNSLAVLGKVDAGGRNFAPEAFGDPTLPNANAFGETLAQQRPPLRKTFSCFLLIWKKKTSIHLIKLSPANP